ncbi:hypothetical protein [Thiothrix fructosivorans]|uniref:hypothetical protein n=1 Tax=Thiothrix fructosivorans TaxID=111770 RepID=UPI001F5EB0C5|nr:hypothetical protein [Thiothrix fructosivorans]
MQFLKIKRRKKRLRADGTDYAEAVFVTKRRKFGDTLGEETVSIKRPVLVTGAHDSGKTKWVKRLHDAAPQIWGSKTKAAPLLLDSLSPLSAWCDSPAVAAWWEAKRKAEEAADPTTARAPWKTIKQHTRADALPDYCKDSGPVLFIDDAHKLNGRKLQIARLCVLSSRLFVISASEENRLAPNLRAAVLHRDPQIFRLDSDVAYDATALLMWFFIVACVAAGWWEAGAVLGGLKLLGSGRRAARAD